MGIWIRNVTWLAGTLCALLKRKVGWESAASLLQTGPCWVNEFGDLLRRSTSFGKR